MKEINELITTAANKLNVIPLNMTLSWSRENDNSTLMQKVELYMRGVTLPLKWVTEHILEISMMVSSEQLNAEGDFNGEIRKCYTSLVLNSDDLKNCIIIIMLDYLMTLGIDSLQDYLIIEVYSKAALYSKIDVKIKDIRKEMREFVLDHKLLLSTDVQPFADDDEMSNDSDNI